MPDCPFFLIPKIDKNKKNKKNKIISDSSMNIATFTLPLTNTNKYTETNINMVFFLLLIFFLCI